MRRTWILMAGLWLLAFGAQAAVRLAVWTGDAELRPAADLLTAGLSRNTNVVMLERTELERLVQEQARGNQGRDVVQAGRLLGADGLCLLERVKTAETNLLVARFVAVGPGVNLGTVLQTWPAADLNGWAQTAQGRLGRLLPKFQVARTNAVPVSILNLRYALDSASGRTLERELSSLLALRLMNEPGVFVLERRRLGELAWEKELAGVNDQPFWNGSWLLEGSIEPVTGRAEAVSVNLQLTRPDSAKPLKIVATGARTNLVGLVESLASQMLAELRVAPAAPAWNASAESVKYFHESQWAWRWGMGDEALVAVENCWALGGQSESLAIFRLQVLHSLAKPDPVWTVGNGRSYSGAPIDLVRFARMREALEFYQDQTARMQSTNGLLDKAWVQTGVQLLDLASGTLEHVRARFRDRIKLGLERPSLELQRTALDLETFLVQQVARLPELERTALGQRLKVMHLRYLSVWHADPDALAAAVRTTLAGGLSAEQVEFLVDRAGHGHDQFHRWSTFGGMQEIPGAPALQAWEPEDRRRVAALWLELKQEMLASTNANLRLAGHILKINETPMAEIPAKVAAAHQAITSPQDGHFYRDLDRGCLDLLLKIVRSGPPFPSKETRAEREALAQHQMAQTFSLYLATATAYDDEALAHEMDPLAATPSDARRILDDLFQYFARLHADDRRGRMAQSQQKFMDAAQYSFAEIRQYLETTTRFESQRLDCFLSRFRYSAAEMAELVKALDDYCRRFPEAKATLNAVVKRELAFRIAYERQLAPPPPPTLQQRVEAHIAYLDGTVKHDPTQFHDHLASESLPPELAQQVLPHLRQYREKVGRFADVDEYMAVMEACALTLKELQACLPKMQSPERSTIQGYFMKRPFSAAEAGQLLPAVQELKKQMTNDTTVSRIFYRLRAATLHPNMPVTYPPPVTSAMRAGALQAAIDYLDQTSAFDPTAFRKHFLPIRPWSPPDARRALPHLQAFHKRLPDQAEVANAERMLQAAAMTFGELRQYLNSTDKPDPQYLYWAVGLRDFTPAEAAEFEGWIPRLRSRLGKIGYIDMMEARVREQTPKVPPTSPGK